MPLFLIPLIYIGASSIIGGVVASKSTEKIREFINEDETVKCKCFCCFDKGPHKFKRIDNSWSAAGALGLAGGAVGGLAKGIVSQRIFKCRNCGVEIYENGDLPGWNADNAIISFFSYRSLEQTLKEMQKIIATSNKIAQNHSKEIEKIYKELNDVTSDKIALEKKIRIVIDKLKNDK